MLSRIIQEQAVERIDLLRMDVEGAEMDVLAGVEEHHWPLVRQLSMEVDPANKRHVAALQDSLRSLGFAHVAVESMFRGASDPGACTVYAVRDSNRPQLRKGVAGSHETI